MWLELYLWGMITCIVWAEKIATCNVRENEWHFDAQKTSPFPLSVYHCCSLINLCFLKAVVQCATITIKITSESGMKWLAEGIWLCGKVDRFLIGPELITCSSSLTSIVLWIVDIGWAMTSQSQSVSENLSNLNAIWFPRGFGNLRLLLSTCETK